MDELAPIVIILSVVSILWIWGLVSQSHARVSWHPVEATYDIVKTFVNRRDQLHGTYLLRIAYHFKGKDYTKLISVMYNRRTMEFYTIDSHALHQNGNTIRIFVNPKNGNRIVYQKEPWWSPLLSIFVLAILWTSICYYVAKH